MISTNFLSLVIFITIIVSCNSTENTFWKYRNGYYIGDVFKFGKYYKIKNDTIYNNQIPKAVIIKIKTRISDKLMMLKEINGDSIGYYCSK